MKMEKFYIWLSNKLPPRLVSHCFIRVMAEVTTGKYSNTIVPELTGMNAINRWVRIHGHSWSDKDEFYDSKSTPKN